MNDGSNGKISRSKRETKKCQMPDPNLSPLAKKVPDFRKDRERNNPPFGLAVHTSGRGVVNRALRRGIQGGEEMAFFIVHHYQHARFSAHYFGSHTGELFQITPDLERVMHIGVNEREREFMLSGRWRKRVSKRALHLWQDRWPNVPSPQHLFPNQFPNDDYLALELSPLKNPQPNGLWFSDAQHRLVAQLYLDRAEAHGWDDRPARLVGHEDLDPFGRWQSKGGWDPGALRRRPRFSWELVYRELESLKALRSAAV